MRSLHETLALAWAAITKPARYVLGAGGRSPGASTPFTDRDGKVGADCIGWVLWAMGIDRYQPGKFTYYDGYMNTDSIIEDAKHKVGGGYWHILTKPRPGCAVVFPSIWKIISGKRTMVRMGHIGLVVEVPAEWPDDISTWSPKERTNLLKLAKVIDCNASLARRISGKAIGQITAAALWDKKDALFAMPEGL